jgi:hypothetical protein
MSSIKGNALYALQLSIVSGISYFFGYFLSGFTLPTVAEVGGLWSVISGVLVMKQHQSDFCSNPEYFHHIFDLHEHPKVKRIKLSRMHHQRGCHHHLAVRIKKQRVAF